MCLRIARITSSERSGELLRLPMAEVTLNLVLGSSRNERKELPFSTPKRTFPTISSTSRVSETGSDANLSRGQLIQITVETENRSRDSKTMSAEQTTSYSGSPSATSCYAAQLHYQPQITLRSCNGEPADVGEQGRLVGEPEISNADLVDVMRPSRLI